MPRQTSRSFLNVRNATLEDIPGIVALSGKVYPVMGAYTEGEIQGQLINFPEGQVVDDAPCDRFISSDAIRARASDREAH